MMGHSIISNNHIRKRRSQGGLDSATIETAFGAHLELEEKGDRKAINDLGNYNPSTCHFE